MLINSKLYAKKVIQKILRGIKLCYFLGGLTSLIIAHPHWGHCLGSLWPFAVHFFPHFKHIQSVMAYTLNFAMILIALNSFS